MDIHATATDDSTATLQRLRTLESLYEQGYHNDVVDRTIYKLLEHQVQQDEAQLAELADSLSKFEQRFGMISAAFYEKYQAGQASDDADHFEWQVLYKMHQRLSQAVDLLKSQLSPAL
ncbi:MAG: hypothetical protein KDE54_14940 [Caldilineaceae bacterium]|nr:hypothetical protein [Caldilineaceae bacterium]MCB0097957.1 hypothetical protein [Caldilineaceae bacterium]MCB0144211.1 hypothetical protein [Caldilineaceae bacterium]MCB9156047.1 hypothetical protein [Caldilineaceae bacterium]